MIGRTGIEKTLAILITLSIVGGVLKIYGSIIGGSKSVFVDAMTSIANTLAIVLILRFFRVSIEPPDADHHYGHHRLAVGGSISMLMVYSFVVGVVILDLVNSAGRAYEVGYESPLYATLALVPYGVAVVIAKRSYSIVSGYGGFTAVELIESFVSIASSLGGIAVSYLVDFLGATALTVYLVFELAKSFREVVLAISDVAPEEVIEKIRRAVESHGVEVDRVRVRRVIEDVYHGDIVVRFASNTPVEDAHRVADDIEKELKSHGIDVTVHVEPAHEEKPKRSRE